MVRHPAVVIQLREVPPSRVRNDDDDHRFTSRFLPDLQGGPYRRARRTSDQDPLVSRDPASREKTVAIRHHHHPVGDLAVIRSRPEVFADSLNEVGTPTPTGVDRACRIGADDLDRRILGFEVTTDARDGAPRSDAGHEMGDAARRLSPDLRSSTSEMCLCIMRVRVLVWLEGTRRGLDQSPGNGVVRLGVVRVHCRRADHHFCAIHARRAQSSRWRSCRAW